MEEMSVLNPAVLGLAGVLMGSVLSLLGNILSQYLLNRKEAQQWARENSAKRNERDLERVTREAEELKNLYHQSISCLSVYLSGLQRSPKDEQVNFSVLIKDIHHWLSKLAVVRPDEELLEALDRFLYDPDSYAAKLLRTYILEMVRNDAKRLDSSYSEAPPQPEKSLTRKILFKIDSEFQKSLMIQGIELPDSFELPYRPEDLLPEHRKRLLDVYYSGNRRIPDNAFLMLPAHRSNSTVVVYLNTWRAKVNPFEVRVDGVLSAWAADFDRCMEEAQSALHLGSE
jgi:hypothetical protein